MTKFTPTVNTTIYDSIGDQPVTWVPPGTVVYDKVTVTGGAGIPTGTVDFTVFTKKADCTGPSNTETKTLVAGVARSSNFATPNKPISYKAHYNGDANYDPADGACEALAVN